MKSLHLFLIWRFLSFIALYLVRTLSIFAVFLLFCLPRVVVVVQLPAGGRPLRKPPGVVCLLELGPGVGVELALAPGSQMVRRVNAAAPPRRLVAAPRTWSLRPVNIIACLWGLDIHIRWGGALFKD